MSPLQFVKGKRGLGAPGTQPRRVPRCEVREEVPEEDSEQDPERVAFLSVLATDASEEEKLKDRSMPRF
jgi:hypothetical protein